MRGPRILLPWKACRLCTFSYLCAALEPAVPQHPRHGSWEFTQTQMRPLYIRTHMNRILVWGMLVGLPWPAFGQQYPILPVPGSPKSVRTLFQDSRGRLWLGGDQVSCFDGTRFFFLRDYGLPPAIVYSIAEDPGGAIWIGAETGVYRFAKGRVERIAQGVATSVIAATPDLAVAAVGPPGRGIADRASLVRMQRAGGGWKTETVVDLDSPGPLTLDPGGLLLYPWPGQGWMEVRLEDVARWHMGTQLPVTDRKSTRL